MKRFSLIAGLAIGIALTGASCGLTTTLTNGHNTKTSVNTTVNAATNTVKPATISYAGQAGKNALDLLKSGHTVDASDQGFVNAIDGVKPGNHQFWDLYVNGKESAVGAKDYITKTGDAIEWKLASY